MISAGSQLRRDFDCKYLQLYGQGIKKSGRKGPEKREQKNGCPSGALTPGKSLLKYLFIFSANTDH